MQEKTFDRFVLNAIDDEDLANWLVTGSVLRIYSKVFIGILSDIWLVREWKVLSVITWFMPRLKTDSTFLGIKFQCVQNLFLLSWDEAWAGSMIFIEQSNFVVTRRIRDSSLMDHHVGNGLKTHLIGRSLVQIHISREGFIKFRLAIRGWSLHISRRSFIDRRFFCVLYSNMRLILRRFRCKYSGCWDSCRILLRMLLLRLLIR